MTLHIDDSRAVESKNMDLGVFQVNFNEGSLEADNLGVRSDFKLLDVITNYFPPEEESKGSVVPFAFCGILGLLFFNFFGSLFSNQANLKNMSFFGMLFVLNYLLILGVIVAFWIQVNLVNTLWILAALAPVTLFTMNKGLTPENCHVSDFHNPQKYQKKK